MRIALFLKTPADPFYAHAKEIKAFLEKEGVEVVFEEKEAASMETKSLSEVDPKTINYMISLGGDGTMLRLAHKYATMDAPLLGINLGSLGFLADVPIPDIFPCLKELISGKGRILERMILEGETESGKKFFAVNDIVVHRAKNPSLIDLSIHVGGDYLNTFSADGVIVATPCGSTAYSLAAGGPILEPNVEALVITPISAHTISNRPIVISPKNAIQITCLTTGEPVEVLVDGVACCSLQQGESFTIRESNRKFRLVALSNHNYFNTLRTKLNWTGKLRGNG